jgi:hypothetical protein
MRIALPLVIFAVSLCGGCATVDVTKTSKGVYTATNPNEVEILTVAPKDRQFVELATVSTTKWSPSDTAKMHNALRSKAAPLGADAVVLLNSGIDSYNGYLWATGTAIRYSDHK